MVQLARKKVLLAGIEGTYGTDPTLSGSSNAILVRNLNINPLNADQKARELVRGFLGNFEQLNANVHVVIDFEVELAASGTLGVAPAYGPLLRACGLAETITADTSVEYDPVSASFESAYMYFNQDGTLHKIAGARGTFELSLKANEIPFIKFTFTGKYVAPTATSAPVADYSDFQKPQIVNNANTTSFSFYSYAGVLSDLSLNLNNDVQHRSLVGYEDIQIVDRKTTGEVVIESPAIGTKDFFAASKAETAGALTILHGSTSGNKVQIDCDQVDLGNPSYEESQGIVMLKLPFQPLPASGNDDLKLTFI